MAFVRRFQPQLRSILFVPGNKRDWMLKAIQYGADALVFDLEDSVPSDQKSSAREVVRSVIEQSKNLAKPRLLVRINGTASGLAEADIETITGPGLFGVMAAKIESAVEVKLLDQAMSRAEARTGLTEGDIFLIPALESAMGVRGTYEISMAARRVAYVMAGAGGTVGDMANSVGYRERTLLETAYIFGKVVLDARAAGVTHPTTGLVADPIKDLDAVRARAGRGRDYGYTGAFIIHPSHVNLVNEVFGPSPEELRYWKGLVDAVEAGERRGTSAVLYDGKMVDVAHLTHARAILKHAEESFGMKPL